MTSNKYIVKNCPARFYSEINDAPKCWELWEKESEYCCNCTDCVIKQVIEKCNMYKNFVAITISDYAKRELALHILDLFDIEEVK